MMFFVVVLVWAPANAQDDDMMSYTVMLGGNEELGTFFTDANGMTLYIFTNDEPNVSNCSGQCIENWPALTVSSEEELTAQPEITGKFSVIMREDDGSLQVTYNGWPLYYWINDAAPGDATGHGVGDVWWVATMPTVGLGGNDELGAFLVGPDAMTLYLFTNDEPNVSNCSGQCIENWPALTVPSEDALTVQPGLMGEFGVITREDDGSLQVTYNGWPLYYWVNDEVPGDATGQGVGDVWYVIEPPHIAIAENETFGQILVGPDGFTLYTFANDTEGVSNCVDQCAINWPPLLLAEGETEVVAAEGISGEVGFIERADGSRQITYNGAPLYYWVKDRLVGDTLGHNVGDVWFVAQP